MNGQVKIGREFFSKIALDYADWKYALVREFLQNSFDAPGCDQVTVDILPEGPNTRLVVYNNGAPMDKDTLFNKLLTLGGSGKNFDGENTGGFGVAKSLLYYTHLSYKIETGAFVVEGSGAEYKVSSQTISHSTKSTILLEGDHTNALTECFQKFAHLAQWKGTLTVNGTELPCNLYKGSRRRDLGWGVVYTNKSASNICVVRLNGQPMFTQYTRFNGCVLIELTGKGSDALTSNRDSLKYSYQSALSDLLTALAVDKRSALREQRAEYKRYHGDLQRNEAKKAKAAEQGLAAIGINNELLESIVGGNVCGGICATPPIATEGGGIKIVITSKEDEPDRSISIGPQFILKNTTGLKTPTRYVPGDKFSPASRELALAWTAMLLKLHQVHNIDGEFSVGFVFDESSEAECENGVYGRVYYINPTKLVEHRLENRYPSVSTSKYRLLSIACHEFVHGAFNRKEHDEDYAGTLTDVMGVAMEHLKELLPLCKAKAGLGVKKGRYYILGHSLTSVLVWMGQNGWSKENATRVVDHFKVECSPMNVSVTVKRGADGTAKSPAAELSEEEIEQLNNIAQ